MSVFDIPIRLYIISEMVMTVTYGMPSAKYSEGTHAHGLLLDIVVVV